MALEKVQVTLPTELLEFAKGLIDGQDFICVDDVIIEALSRFRPVMDNERRQHEWLKAEIQKGIDELDRGEGLDGEAVMDEIMARFRKPTPVPTT